MKKENEARWFVISGKWWKLVLKENIVGGRVAVN